MLIKRAHFKVVGCHGAPSDARKSNENPDFFFGAGMEVREFSRDPPVFVASQARKARVEALERKLKQQNQQTMKESMRKEADSWGTASVLRASASVGDPHDTYNAVLCSRAARN